MVGLLGSVGLMLTRVMKEIRSGEVEERDNDVNAMIKYNSVDLLQKRFEGFWKR